MEIILLLIRLILAAVLTLAGVGKLLDLEGSEKAVKGFGIPNDSARFFALALPIAEISLAVLLLPTSTSWVGAIGTFLLLLAFCAAMIWQLARGKAPDCHCFGQIHSEPVGAKSLIRNSVFALLAFVLVVSGNSDQGLGFTELSNELALGLILGLTGIGFLAFTVFYLKNISEQQTQILRRIEVMELIAGDGREVKRDDVFSPHEGLPIGAPAPSFELEDMEGDPVASEHLLAFGKPILLFFVSPTCTPCQALLPEIETWQQQLGDKIKFVFISSGKPLENLEKLRGNAPKQILLQEKREVAELFSAQWTPTALLINVEGKIASRLAAGDAAIRDLVEKIKAENLETGYFFVENGESNNRPHVLGKIIPDFSVEDIKGNSFSKEDFYGKKTLVTFWSLSCPHCKNLIEDLRTWDKTKGKDEPDLVIFSSGAREEHENLGVESPVLLDKNYEISRDLGMSGTPSAVLIDENGKIVSETAIGAPQIWALIGKRK